MKLIKTFASLPTAVAVAAILAATPMPEGSPFASAAAAQEEKKEQETRKVPALSLTVHNKVQKAQEAIDVKDLVNAKEILAEILEKKGINDYERAVVWQMTAMISFEEDDTAGTIRAYEQILRYRESIPVALELQIMYGLAQLYYSEENYDLALKYVKEWEPRAAEFVGVSQLTFISQLYYVRNEFPQSINYIDRAIAMAQTVDTIEVKENWYSLKLSAHWELNQFDKVRDTLEIMLVSWPKPQYWVQLAGVYQELGEEQAFFSLLEAAYKQGFLDDKEAQLINVAQIQQSRQAPIKCAWILQRAMNEKRVEETATNLRTLGQCYMMAAEYEDAVAPLSAAAKKEDQADLWLQVGQVQLAIDDLSGAVTSFTQAIKRYSDEKTNKSKDKAFATMMLQAQAQIELKHYKDARDTFAAARKIASDQKQKKQVRQWSDYLKAEEEREKMLTGEG